MLLALVTVAMWSTVATAFKWSLREWSPLQLLTVAATVSLLALTLVVLARREHRLLAGLSASQWRLHLSLGLVNPALYYLVLFTAYDRLPAQEAQAINYTWSLVLIGLSAPLLRQRITGTDWLAALLGYAGVLVIATRGAPLSLEFQEPVGVGLAVLSTLLWALYWIASTRQALSVSLGLWLHFLSGTVVLWLLLGLFGTWPQFLDAKHLSRGLLGAAYVGLFEMSLAFLCWQKAMRLVSRTALIGNLIYLSPLVSLLLIHEVLGEPILASTVWGLGLILLGIGLQQWQRST